MPVLVLSIAAGLVAQSELQGASRSLFRYPLWNVKEYRMDLIRILIAILLPPLGVFLQVGFGGAFWLNILLRIASGLRR